LSDVVCHDFTTGEIWTAITTSAGPFGGPVGHYDAGWCPGANTRLSAGDLDGDGRGDLICVDPDSGTYRVWLMEADGTLGARESGSTVESNIQDATTL